MDAVKRKEILKRAERFRALQAYGVTRRTELGPERESVESVVERVMAKYGDIQRNTCPDTSNRDRK